ncbi:MAG: hypothetical protein Q9M92_03575 [Enterobacterales bacterium]|nr:hypothetical protein [Enterobacterales bacterium]
MLNKILSSLFFIAIGILIGYALFSDQGDASHNKLAKKMIDQQDKIDKQSAPIFSKVDSNYTDKKMAKNAAQVKPTELSKKTEKSTHEDNSSVNSDAAGDEVSNEQSQDSYQNWNYTANQLIDGPVSELLFKNDIWIEQTKCNDDQCLISVASDVNNRRFPASISNTMDFISKQSGFTPGIKSIQREDGQWVAQIVMYKPGAPVE